MWGLSSGMRCSFVNEQWISMGCWILSFLSGRFRVFVTWPWITGPASFTRYLRLCSTRKKASKERAEWNLPNRRVSKIRRTAAQGCRHLLQADAERDGLETLAHSTPSKAVGRRSSWWKKQRKVVKIPVKKPSRFSTEEKL